MVNGIVVVIVTAGTSVAVVVVFISFTNCCRSSRVNDGNGVVPLTSPYFLAKHFVSSGFALQSILVISLKSASQMASAHVPWQIYHTFTHT